MKNMWFWLAVSSEILILMFTVIMRAAKNKWWMICLLLAWDIVSALTRESAVSKVSRCQNHSSALKCSVPWKWLHRLLIIFTNQKCLRKSFKRNYTKTNPYFFLFLKEILFVIIYHLYDAWWEQFCKFFFFFVKYYTVFRLRVVRKRLKRPLFIFYLFFHLCIFCHFVYWDTNIYIVNMCLSLLLYMYVWMLLLIFRCFGVVFERSLFMLTKAAFIWSNIL